MSQLEQFRQRIASAATSGELRNLVDSQLFKVSGLSAADRAELMRLADDRYLAIENPNLQP